MINLYRSAQKDIRHQKDRYTSFLCLLREGFSRMGLLRVAVIATFLAPSLAHSADTLRDPKGLNLIKPVTSVAHEIVRFNDILTIMCFAISIFVLVLLVYTLWRFRASRPNPEISKRTHNGPLEVLWTVIPALIIAALAVPSFRLIHLQDNPPEPELTVIARGYQWYWTYELPDLKIEEYSSVPIPDEEIQPDQVRLLSVDVPLVIPSETNVQFLVTSGDVLHAFAMPNFAVKVDAIPGRMQETWANIPAEHEGTYYGQCSELCGTGHGYMPLEIRVVSKAQFETWVSQSLAAGAPAAPPTSLPVLAKASP